MRNLKLGTERRESWTYQQKLNSTHVRQRYRLLEDEEVVRLEWKVGTWNEEYE
jgi:hypothetical protein